MTTYRSTTLALLDKHCPRALDFQESGTYRDREFFQAGIAAHAVLQACGEDARLEAHLTSDLIAEGVVRQLVTVGRSFDGRAEPPMSPEQATQGRDIALRYLADHDLSPTAKYEAGLAVDANWKPVAYGSPEAYYQAAVDYVDVIETADDDGYQTTTVITADWKSSWQTDADECETIQLKGQSALALAHYPNATVLRRRAVNLRTGVSYDADVTLDEDGLAVVAGWRRDIGHAIAAADVRQADGRRPARPGAGCYGCPWLMVCDAAENVTLTTGDSPESMALRYMLAEAMRAALLPQLKALAAEAPIVTPDGTVGYVEKSQRKATDEAPRAIVTAWFNGAADDAVVGLLTALKVGVTGVTEVAKTLNPVEGSGKEKTWKSAREELESKCLRDVTVSEFQITKTKE